MLNTVEVKKIVDNFTLWKGDSYKLAVLCAERANELLMEEVLAKLEAANMQEAADLLRQ